jgi:hypothetical protein
LGRSAARDFETALGATCNLSRAMSERFVSDDLVPKHAIAEALQAA